MISRPRKSTVNTLKKSLGEVRKYLQDNVPKFEDKTMIPVEFSRIGTHYRIEHAPVPPTDKLGMRFEKSFNEFMKQMKLDYDSPKLEGRAMIHTKADYVVIEYKNLENKNGEVIVKNNKALQAFLEGF